MGIDFNLNSICLYWFWSVLYNSL